MLMHSHPILSRFLIWVVLPIILIMSLVYAFLLQSLPQKEGSVQMEGLDSTVRIIRDEHGIPHIKATTDHDAFFAMGYVHAQDRLWQMNYYRRIGQGRLSEIMGRNSLGVDQLMRTVGLYRAVKNDLEILDESARQSLIAYAKGVNAWIQENQTLPVEFYLFDTKPELWKPEDSLLLIKISAYNLAFNFAQELSLELLVKELGLAKANELIPNVNLNTPAVTEITDLVDLEIVQGLIAQDEQLEREYGTNVEGVGSNAWVVSGELTKSGKPILANDPHLATEIPSFWYLAEIQGEQLHVTGATFPGVPFVFMGHNDDIAWGTTNMLADSQDLFIMRINPLNENQYEVDGQWLDMDVEEELIHIKPDFPSFLTYPIPPLKWEIRKTQYGPLISDVIGRVERPLALKWTGLAEQDKSYQGFLKVNYAKGWEDFKSAMHDYSAPAVNFVYADVQGNIGLFAGGKIPIREHNDGRLPVPGWQSKYDWKGYIPVDSLPQIFNPENGYIVNANNKNHPDDYPYIIANNWSVPYRHDRISQVIESYIESGRKISVQDFVDLQGDFKDLLAQEALAFFQGITPITSQQEEILNQLKQWDGELTEDSTEGSIFPIWLKHFNFLLLQDDLKGDLLHMARGDQLQNFVNGPNPKLIRKIIAPDNKLQHDWCDQLDTNELETCEDIALMAFDLTYEELEGVIGISTPWGDIHATSFPHLAFTNSQFLNSIFDREVSSGGGRYTVNNARWIYTDDGRYLQNVGPNYRQVLELNDWNQSGFINDTGQSGNILSEHYDDNILPHKQLQLWPMHFGVEQALEDEQTLKLEPIK